MRILVSGFSRYGHSFLLSIRGPILKLYIIEHILNISSTVDTVYI